MTEDNSTVSGKFLLVETQSKFIDTHTEFRKNYAAANQLGKSELESELLRKLAEFVHAEEWEGKIIGVNTMNGKGSLEVEIGGNIRLFAGDHVIKGVSTLIDRQKSSVFDFIRTTKNGTKVRFKGVFPKYDNKLIEISYTDDGAIKAPKYLFNFEDLKELSE